MSLDDDWLKPQCDDHREAGPSNSVSGGLADLHLPADLQLPDLGRWWVDLEFLDLASGPPANVSSANQDRNKNKNPTLGYNFPDIFFDTTSSNLFDDNHRFDKFVNEPFKDHGLDFEKGLLADLFPTTNVPTNEKLLDDIDLGGPSQTSQSDSQVLPSTSQSGDEPNDKSSAKSNDDLYTMGADVLNSISELDHMEDGVSKMSDFKIDVDETSRKSFEQLFLELSDKKLTKNDEKDEIYSVPADVLQNISKNFSDLQEQFENVAGSSSVEACDTSEKRNAHSEPKCRLRVVGVKKLDEFSSKTEHAKGTLARIVIKTDKHKNTAVFSIFPDTGDRPEQSFTVHTGDMRLATNMVKPLHLSKLPIFQRILKDLASKPATKSSVIRDTQSSRDVIYPEQRKTNLDLFDSTRVSNAGPEQVKGSSSSLHHILSSPRIEEPPTLLSCSECEGCFEDQTSLRNHISQEHHKQPATLRVKDSVATSSPTKTFLKELANHGIHLSSIEQGTSSKGKSWICPDCGKGLPKMSLLKEHVFRHRNIKPFCCEESGCSWAFYTASKLKRHKTTVHGDKTTVFTCNMPGCELRKFSTVYNLNAHLKKHGRLETFECNVCPQKFSLQKSLDSHYKTHHPNHREFKCQDCEKKFYSPLDLSAHRRVHTGPSQVCSEPGCGRVFDKPSELKLHSYIHSGVRPFACQFEGCSWAFRTISKLRRHERTHKNDRNSICSLCDKAYLRPEHLRSHMLSAHNNIRFACPIASCGAKFSAQSTLYSHMKKHKETKRSRIFYRCVLESCGKKFEDRRLLTRHVNQVHGTEFSSSHCVKIVSQSEYSEELDFIALLSSVEEDASMESVESEVKSPDLNNVLTFVLPDVQEHRDVIGEAVEVETEAAISVSTQPKELVTVDTSAITPMKNSHQQIPNMSLMKSSSARTDPQKNQELLSRLTEKKVNVVIVPEGFVGDF